MKTPDVTRLMRHGKRLIAWQSPSYSTVRETLYEYKGEYYKVTEFTRTQQTMVTNVKKTIGDLMYDQARI